MGVLHGRLEPEGYKLLKAALDAFDTGPDPIGGLVPPRTESQRKSDALMDLCRAGMSTRGKRPGGVPRVDVVYDARVGSREFLGGPAVSFATFMRMLCDGEVSTVELDERGEVLHLGRATRTVSDAQRRSLAIRDGGCRFTGCDRPHQWCDAHHVEWWERGGRTDVENLVLLCRRHHVLVHEGGWHLERNAQTGAVVVLAPGHGRAPPEAA
jgi:hypothetical protein